MMIQPVETTQNTNPTAAPEQNNALQNPQIAEIRVRDAESLTGKPKIVEELVIEEVSIDGMCGVY